MRSSLLTVLSILSSAPLGAQAPTSTHGARGNADHLDSLARASVRDLPLASASVAVLQREDTLLFAAYGYADLENGVRAGPETVYRIGSITKQFTAAAILQQVDHGALSLDDDITRYVPEFSSRGKRVKIRQLLNHTSGLKDFGDLGDRFLAVRSRDLPQRDVLALVRQIRFDSEPGTKWRYSNAGYYLLGVILERITGQRYIDYLQERIFKAAGLTGTGGCDPRVLVPHRARGYDAIGTEFLNASYVSMSIPFSSEGLCSTAGDLVRWARALRAGRVISPAAYRTMTTPEGAAARASPPYGYGVWVIKSGSRTYISHLGVADGFNAGLSDIPADSLTIAVVTNTSGFGASTLGGQLGSAILGTPRPSVSTAVPLAPPKVRALTQKERDRYVGRYGMRTVIQTDTLGGIVTLDVFGENGRLMAQLTGDPPETLVAVGDHEFVALDRPDLRFTFELQKERAIRAILVGPTIHAEGPRIPR
jgi:CubicO group peptidase (beta-lactamase class C family)